MLFSFDFLRGREKMYIYAFTACMEASHRTILKKRGVTVRQFTNLDLDKIDMRKFKKDAIYYLGSDFPVYTKVLGLLLEKEVEKIILELPEHAMLESVVRKSNMAFIPAHSDSIILETALLSLGLEPIRDDRLVWGNHPGMQRIKRLIPRISNSDVSIHISGEVGSGKNTIADEIARTRGLDKAIYINCASLSSNLAEDVLFGHSKGAYTNATESRVGLCKEADGGIMFLDELQDLPNDAQSKLLHLLETGEYRQNGSNRIFKSKFKIITSSSLPYDKLIKELRTDFMSRIGTIVIDVPPLRERMEDLDELIDMICTKRKFRNRPGYEEIERMKRYKWPGNIRELASILEYYEYLEELPEDL